MGITLLWGSRLTADVLTGGAAVIEELAAQT